MQKALFVQRFYWHVFYFITERPHYEEAREKFLPGPGSELTEFY